MAYSIYPTTIPSTIELYVMADQSSYKEYNFTNSYYQNLAATLGEDFYADTISNDGKSIHQCTCDAADVTVINSPAKNIPCLRKTGWGTKAISLYSDSINNSEVLACIWDVNSGEIIKGISLMGSTGSGAGVSNYSFNIFNIRQDLKIIRLNHAQYAQGSIVLKDNMIIGGPWRNTALSVQGASDYTLGVYDCATNRQLIQRTCPYHQLSDNFIQLVKLEYVNGEDVECIDDVYYATIVPNAAADRYYIHGCSGVTYIQVGGKCFNNSSVPILVVQA